MVLRITSKPQTETDMTIDKKVARRKLSLLELASDLGNVSKACRVIGYSRDPAQTLRPMAPMGCSTVCPAPRGRTPTGWRPRSRRRSSIMPWLIPVTAPTRVAQELMLRGIQVSSGGVRGVWQPRSLLTKHDRLLKARLAR
jgi:hypothetical protein